jgi:hypothetical protein
MKLIVVHDEYGNIKSAAAAPAMASLRAGLRPQRGEFVTEVEAPAIGPEELRGDLRAIGQHFRVDLVNARLVPKAPYGAG